MAHEMFLAEDFAGKSKNIYSAIMMIAARSRQIAEQQRKEMDAYLSQVDLKEKYDEDDEGMIEEAPVIHEPTIQFEKPTVLSLREMIADKLSVVGEEQPIEEVVEPAVLVAPTKFPDKLSIKEVGDDE